MPIIFRKTAKGVAEIGTRAHRLTPRMRSTLILVDGKRDADDMRALVTQQADETLAGLLEQGFIEAVGETVRAAPAPRPAAAPAQAPTAQAPTAQAATATPATPATPTPTAPTAAPPAKQENMDTLRRSVVRALNDELGPAAEGLAVRIERAKTVDDLRPLLVQAVQLVGSARGRAAAEAFATRMPEI